MLWTIDIAENEISKSLYKYQHIYDLKLGIWDWGFINKIYWTYQKLDGGGVYSTSSTENLYQIYLHDGYVRLNFNNEYAHRRFMQDWIHNPKCGNPITYNKFNNGLEIPIRDKISIHIFIEAAIKIKDELTTFMGPQYVNWHLYYSLTNPHIMIAFANDEVYTWFKLRY